jgi:hypothetical protein
MVTSARHALRNIERPVGAPVHWRANRYPILVSLGAVFAALILVATVMVLFNPPLHSPQSEVRYWTFDAQSQPGADLLADFGIVTHGTDQSTVTVGSDGLTHAPATNGSYASYIEREFGGPVDKLGVTATFPPALDGVTGGTVALLAPSHGLPTDPKSFDSDVPNMGIHFAFDANIWVMALWRQDGGQEVLGTGQFLPPLSNDRSVEIIRRADEVTIYLPDGGQRRFHDTRIANWSGNWAAWELYEKAAPSAPAAIRRLWAGWSAT